MSDEEKNVNYDHSSTSEQADSAIVDPDAGLSPEERAKIVRRTHCVMHLRVASPHPMFANSALDRIANCYGSLILS